MVILSSEKFKVLANESNQLIDQIQDKKIAIRVFEEFLNIMDIPDHVVALNRKLVKEQEITQIISWLRNNVEIAVSQDFGNLVCSCHRDSYKGYSSQFVEVLRNIL